MCESDLIFISYCPLDLTQLLITRSLHNSLSIALAHSTDTHVQQFKPPTRFIYGKTSMREHERYRVKATYHVHRFIFWNSNFLRLFLHIFTLKIFLLQKSRFSSGEKKNAKKKS